MTRRTIMADNNDTETFEESITSIDIMRQDGGY